VDILCLLLDVARSSYYDYLRQKNQQAQGHQRQRPGPKVQLDDSALLQAILSVMTASPFVTEGVKKVHARLRRQGIKASRKRINLIMRENGLLSPQRHEQGEEKKHEGTIIPDSINQIWGTDGTLFGAINGDLLWLFAVIERFFKTLKLECLWIENFRDVDHARDVVGCWMETYNTQWLIERHGHRTPREIRQACRESQSAVA